MNVLLCCSLNLPRALQLEISHISQNDSERPPESGCDLTTFGSGFGTGRVGGDDGDVEQNGFPVKTVVPFPTCLAAALRSVFCSNCCCLGGILLYVPVIMDLCLRDC